MKTNCATFTEAMDSIASLEELAGYLQAAKESGDEYTEAERDRINAKRIELMEAKR